jgi:hypothetical protein
MRLYVACAAKVRYVVLDNNIIHALFVGLRKQKNLPGKAGFLYYNIKAYFAFFNNFVCKWSSPTFMFIAIESA